MEQFWRRLKGVKNLVFTARTTLNGEHRGNAVVEISSPTPSILIFTEKGEWIEPRSGGFINRFRWTLNQEATLIALEHLRYGQPVFLFHLISTQSGLLNSVDPHICGQDTYLGSISWDERSINFRWHILGPCKNDHLLYKYN